MPLQYWASCNGYGGGSDFVGSSGKSYVGHGITLQRILPESATSQPPAASLVWRAGASAREA